MSEPLRLPSVVSAPRVRCDTGRDALRELESTARLLEQIDDVLGPLGITDVFRLRIRERIGSIRITLKREWQRRAGGKTGDES